MDIGSFNPPSYVPYKIDNGFMEGLNQSQDYSINAQKLQQALLENQKQRAIQAQQIAAMNAQNAGVVEQQPSLNAARIAENEYTSSIEPSKLASGIQQNLATQKYAMPEEYEKYQGMVIGNKYKPLLDMATVQNALSKQQQLAQQQSRFGGAYNMVHMIQAMDPAYKAQWLSNPDNAKAYDTATAIIGNQYLQQASNAPQQTQPSLFQDAIQKQLEKLGYKVPSYNNSQLAPTGIAPVQFPAPSEEQISEETDTAASSAIHHTQTAAQQNQKLFGATAEQLYQEGDPLIDSVKEFTGAKGAAKLIKNMSSAFAGGQTDKQYDDYIKFKTQIVPAYANELKRTLGGQATDQESRIFNEATSPNLLWTTPKQVQSLWDQLHEIAKRQEKVLRKSPAEINKGESSNKKKWKYNPQTDSLE